MGRKLKSGHRFLKPHFELGPNWAGLGDGFDRLFVGFWMIRFYQISKNSSDRIYKELLLERGLPGLETPDIPDAESCHEMPSSAYPGVGLYDSI